MLLNSVLRQIHQVVNTVPAVGDGLVALVDVDRGALLDLRLPHEDEDVDDQLGHSARDQTLHCHSSKRLAPSQNWHPIG